MRKQSMKINDIEFVVEKPLDCVPLTNAFNKDT